MNTHMEMIISDSHFCRKIISKYKQEQRNSFGLPLMIFRKKAGRILGHNIHMNILLQLNPVDGKIVFSSILKSVQNMQGLFSWSGFEKCIHQQMRLGQNRTRPGRFSWFGSEKYILEPIARSSMIKGFTCVNKLLPQIHRETASRFFSVKDVSVNSLIFIRSVPSAFRRAENMIPALKKVRRPLLKIAKAVSCLHSELKDLSSNFTVIHQRYNTTGIFQMINFDGRYPSSPEKKTGKIFPAFGHPSPAILPQVDFLLNKRSNQVSQNWVMGNKSSIKQHQYITGNSLLFAPWEKRLFESLQLKKPMGQNLKINERKQSAGRINNFGSAAANPIVSPVSTVFKAESENFYFHSQQMIEKELNEIKKNIVETKEAVKEKSVPDRSSMDMDIKKHFDINRLSDQVYRNIEQRIRIERERRGL